MTRVQVADGERLLTPAEVRGMFRVSRAAVSKWARDGRLRRVRTPGGASRYLAAEVEALLASTRQERTP